jgi:hypothetical protein
MRASLPNAGSARGAEFTDAQDRSGLVGERAREERQRAARVSKWRGDLALSSFQPPINRWDYCTPGVRVWPLKIALEDRPSDLDAAAA